MCVRRLSKVTLKALIPVRLHKLSGDVLVQMFGDNLKTGHTESYLKPACELD